jgi:hypothetical protein
LEFLTGVAGRRRMPAKRKNQRAEAEAEVSKNVERVMAFGDGDVGLRIRRAGNRVLLFSHYSLRKKLNKTQASSEVIAALASILARRPFGFVKLEVEGENVYLSFSILRKYEMPAADGESRCGQGSGSEPPNQC